MKEIKTKKWHESFLKAMAAGDEGKVRNERGIREKTGKNPNE